ncbi:MAG: hypothetical protein WED34_16155, partial [Planctomycetales bacterium]
MRSFRLMLVLTAAIACIAPSLAAEVRFAEPLRVAKTGEGATIAFALDRAADVEVTVVDARGNVVRHLAAGVLGDNAPAPLQPKSLAQSLAWDGKGDDGQPAPGGPFRVRVAAGMTPRLDGYLLDVPDATPPVHSVAVGPEGRVYAFYSDATANSNQGGVKIKVLDREGHHVKQLVPFPADLPFERVRAFGTFRDEEGALVPRIHNWQTLGLYPDTTLVRGRSTGEYGLPAVESSGRLHWLIDEGVLASLDADGGAAYESFLSEPLFPDLKLVRGLRAALAVSGDGKSLYVSGVWTGAYSDVKPVPAVYRVDLASRGPADVFLGDPQASGKEQDRFTEPRGIAVAGGFLYVADPAADRVAVFRESDRSFVSEIKLTAPQTVSVHPRTGALYVVAHTGPQTADLIKFENRETGRELYRLSLPQTGMSPNFGIHRAVLDAFGDTPRLWMPSLSYARQGRRLSWIDDTGEKLELHDISQIDEPWGDGPRDLTIDRRGGELFVKTNMEQWHEIDEQTGKVRKLTKFQGHNMGMNSTGTQLLVAPDGNFITLSWGNGLMRWDRDGNSLGWPGRDNHRGSWGGIMTFQQQYMDLKGDELFVIPPADWKTGKRAATPFTSLLTFGMDEKPKRTLIWQCSVGTIPRVDAKGNIYLATMVKPEDRDYPPFFDDKLPPAPETYRKLGDGGFWYGYMYGSIVKFPPEGGAVWFDPKLPESALGEPPAELLAKPKTKFRYHRAYQGTLSGELQGAEWTRFGFAPYSDYAGSGTPLCMCEGAGFAVDPFGRVFFPNLGQFRIEVVDTNNNPITTFGGYGNQDSRGNRAESAVKTPLIPLAWPTYVAVSDTHAYVSDTVNLRVAKVKLDYAAEATAAV